LIKLAAFIIRLCNKRGITHSHARVLLVNGCQYAIAVHIGDIDDEIINVGNLAGDVLNVRVARVARDYAGVALYFQYPDVLIKSFQKHGLKHPQNKQQQGAKAQEESKYFPFKP